MSTERKPGSRGVLEPSTLERGNQAPERRDGEAGTRRDGTSKGSTKTSSPRDGFKKRRKK